MASFDTHTNLAYALVATAPSPATSGTSLVVTTGYGSTLGTPPFNMTVWATGVAPISSNAEIVRVTAISTDTLTIIRAQEGTTARSIVVGDQIAVSMTAKTFTDIETAVAGITAQNSSWSTTPVDMSTTIQAAIDALYTAASNNGGEGGTLQLGAGIYYGSFKMRRGVSIQGMGKGTVLRAMPGQTASILDYATYDAYHVRISNLRIDGNMNAGTPAACRCIDMTSSSSDAYALPLPNSATNNSPDDTATGTWGNTYNIIENVDVTYAAGDYAVVIGRNQRLAFITKLSVVSCAAGAMLVDCTDSHFFGVTVGNCSDGIINRGGLNKFTNCKSWYMGINTGYNLTTGPNSTTYYGDGYRLEPLSNFGGNDYAACEAQDNKRYGFALAASHSSANVEANVIRGVEGGSGTAALFLSSPTSSNQSNNIELSMVRSDTSQTTSGVILSGTSTAANRIRLLLDNLNVPGGFVPVTLQSSATLAFSDIWVGATGENTHVDYGTISGGTWTISSGAQAVALCTVGAAMNVAAVSSSVGFQNKIILIITQDSTGRAVTWDSSWHGAPAVPTTKSSVSTFTFVNTSTTATPSWQYVGSSVSVTQHALSAFGLLPVSSSGSQAILFNSAYAFNVAVYDSDGSASGKTSTWSLDGNFSGTYSLNIYFGTGPNFGIITVEISTDGGGSYTTLAAGTDLYAGSYGPGQSSYTGIAIPGGNSVLLRFTGNSKNASSSAYYYAICAWELSRTGA